MQKVVDMMISHCGLGKDSVFIDVGAGLGKPNIHVAQVGRRDLYDDVTRRALGSLQPTLLP